MALLLHPLEQIVNVNWGTVSVFWLAGPQGEPTWIGQRMDRKSIPKFVNGDETLVSLPTISGPIINLPTETGSLNATFNSVELSPHGYFINRTVTQTGNALEVAPSIIRIDWRGYMEVTPTKFNLAPSDNGLPGHFWTVSEPKIFFDRNGNTISKIPNDSAQFRGVPIARDAEGNQIYALGKDLRPPPSGQNISVSWQNIMYSITKYDPGFQDLWTRSGYNTFYLDPQSNQIIGTAIVNVIGFASKPDGTTNFQPVKHWIDLDSGSISKTVNLPGSRDPQLPANYEFIAHQMPSKNGRVFGVVRNGATAGYIIIGFDVHGNRVMQTEEHAPAALGGEITSSFISRPTATPFGENFLVGIWTHGTATGFQIGDGTTATVINTVRVYDPNTGKELNKEQWNGDMLIFQQFEGSTSGSTLVGKTSFVTEVSTTDITNYSSVNASVIPHHFPISNWPPPPVET